MTSLLYSDLVLVWFPDDVSIVFPMDIIEGICGDATLQECVMVFFLTDPMMGKRDDWCNWNDDKNTQSQSDILNQTEEELQNMKLVTVFWLSLLWILTSALL